jgi:hypothetical protein
MSPGLKQNHHSSVSIRHFTNKTADSSVAHKMTRRLRALNCTLILALEEVRWPASSWTATGSCPACQRGRVAPIGEELAFQLRKVQGLHSIYQFRNCVTRKRTTRRRRCGVSLLGPISREHVLQVARFPRALPWSAAQVRSTFSPQGITVGITSGIHTAKLPFLGVQVAPKLKHRAK